ncbi:MAG: hypothetical protein A3H98_12990 [Bacteroidetes bacterium RIFCSPLOWO2_02_FULL_36_8]|nr:MAG: hypothetical protein A3H98_12990 [Bacteroidetes bacterium RIFCSPLOWO2_02_FULL_36_8]OFY69630.1 MAG: hypothetical protein A3G23_13940 [Bacteroidetes bacterium RIFCSPLOWO2_12_FULL_37_12]
MKQSIVYIILLIFISIPVFSQKKDKKYWEEEYMKGKTLFEKNDFKGAMEQLKPAALTTEGNPFAPYSSYYYALSAFRLEKYDPALLMLINLRKNFPGWNKISDVYYLLANISFIKGNLSQAISYLDGVYDEKLKNDKENMKLHYLRSYAKKEILVELTKAFQYDAVIAEVLAQTLAESEFSEANLNLIEQLMKRFDSEKIKECHRLLSNSRFMLKESYNIGILLPFYLDTKNPSEVESRRAQMAFDMIRGIKAGVDTLNKLGLKINIFAYDVTLDTLRLKELLAKPEFKKMDLLIGPVFNASSRIVARFSKQNEVTMINPLSPNDELLKDNDYAFLVKPSISMQAKKMAEYAYEHFVPRKAVILFSSSDIDKSFATAYKEEYERLAGEVSVFKEITKTDMDNVATIINSFPLSGVGHIYVPSSEERIIANLLSILDVLRIKIPIVGISDWLNFETISFEQMEKNLIHFVNADIIDYNNPECINFRKNFINRYNTVPSLYAFQGYDVLLFFGIVLKNFGTNFHEKIHTLPLSKGLQLQFDYHMNNDNMRVIIYGFQESQLKPLNVE